MDGPLLVAQVTDTHVVGASQDRDELHVDNNARLALAVERILAERPAVAAVLLTGDLVNDARPDEYDALAELVAPLTMPVLAIPGNHDDRARVRSTFPDLPWADADHASWVVEVQGGDETVRIVGLDSTLPGDPGPDFDRPREDWLRSALDEPFAGQTVLAMHHPPFDTGIEWMDGPGFSGVERLAAVLAEHPVDRIVAGHVHRPVQGTIAGIPAQVCLSTVQHVELDLAAGAGVSLVLDPTGYQLHLVRNGGIVTHTRYVEPNADPFVPDWADEFMTAAEGSASDEAGGPADRP